MAVFKCKMCGGNIEFEQGATVGVCDSCGTKQTLPKLDDDRRANLYDRANHFRRNNEFDKAMGIYEQILDEDNTDAEAYWSLVLCHYGIEYVEDPATHKRIPTVNRAQYTSVFDDDNYKSALQHADGYQKSLYEEEAATINEIQKGILAISQKEEPFDVFICYKETDANGRRTQDSVLANDLYHQLTGEGYKVFFSRITLEDKLGIAYEPYIFAALNSAKVMVVLGTKPEYFNAVWVKNEWSRYLGLVKQSGGKKILIPAYRDMDPYDLPEEFSHLQAQDMSKLGFMQDLIRGIGKLISSDKPQSAPANTASANVAGGDVAALIKRAFLFLEDGDWKNANEYCERVLDMDPENGEAYTAKLMAAYNVRKTDDISDLKQDIRSNVNYQKAVRYGNTYLGTLGNKTAYNYAMSLLQAADTEEKCLAAAEAFTTLSDYEDATDKVAECRKKAEEVVKSITDRTNAYNDLIRRMNFAKTEEEWGNIANAFQGFSGFMEADSKAEACRSMAEKIRRKIERKRERKVIGKLCGLNVFLFGLAFICGLSLYIILERKSLRYKTFGYFTNPVAWVIAGIALVIAGIALVIVAKKLIRKNKKCSHLIGGTAYVVIVSAISLLYPFFWVVSIWQDFYIFGFIVLPLSVGLIVHLLGAFLKFKNQLCKQLTVGLGLGMMYVGVLNWIPILLDQVDSTGIVLEVIVLFFGIALITLGTAKWLGSVRGFLIGILLTIGSVGVSCCFKPKNLSVADFLYYDFPYEVRMLLLISFITYIVGFIISIIVYARKKSGNKIISSDGMDTAGITAAVQTAVSPAVTAPMVSASAAAVKPVIQATSSVQPAHKFCASCGNKLEYDAKFCDMCGAKQ